jgi:predicted Zn-dependent protease
VNASQWLEKVAPALRRKGLVDYEVYLKQGKSRRFEIGPQGVVASHSQESGWAIRAAGRRTSLFVAGSDCPPRDGPWPEPDGYPIQLPSPFPGDPWQEPADIATPLMVESEALDLLDACVRELEQELPGARLLRAVLEDGESSSEIANSHGVESTGRTRSATLLLEATAPGGANHQVTEFVAERAARHFNPRPLGRRLTDRLIVRSRGSGVDRDRAPCLLAPAVAVRVLAGLLPLVVGPEATGRARARADRQGRLASNQLTIVDDPRLARGLFSSETDGEGVPTRTVTLVEGGVFRRPLVGWWQAEAYSARPPGCLRRPGWREPPQVGPSNLFIRPDRSASVRSLLTAVPRGYYFLETLPGARFDLAADRFHLPVSGFRISDGRATQPISRAVVSGRIGALLHGIQSVGRDLTFFPVGAALGAPSLLINGLAIAD